MCLQVVMSEHVETALDSLLQTAGLGGLGPNTAIAAWPDRCRYTYCPLVPSTDHQLAVASSQ